jgi:hypothetical protein
MDPQQIFIFLFFLFVLIAKLEKSDDPFIKKLFVPQGPRTDTQNMNRQELFQNGLVSLKLSLFLVLIAFGLSYLMIALRPREVHVLTILLIITVILILAAFFGGLFLLILGLFRRKNFCPPQDKSLKK